MGRRVDRWIARRSVPTLLFLLLLGPLPIAVVLSILLGALAGPNAAQIPLAIWTLWVVLSVAAL